MSYCTVCGTEFSGNFCPKCGKAVDSSTTGGYAQQNPYANAQQNSAPQYQQPYQNTQQPYGQPNPYAQNYNYPPVNVGPISAKSRLTALLLCIFLGTIGVHHFYVGRVGYGILYIFTFGLFGIGTLVDLILIATGSYKDSYGLPVLNWNA